MLGIRQLCAILFLAPLATAQTTALSNGKLSLEFNDASGRPARLVYAGRVLGEWPQQAAPASFSVGPADKIQSIDDLKLPRVLVKIGKPGPDRLEVRVRYGDYELVEKYRVHSDSARIDRSAALTNRGTEVTKLRNFTFSTPIKATSGGFYRMPGRWPPQPHSLGHLVTGTSTSYAGRDLQTQHSGNPPTRTGGSIAPMAVQIAPKLSAIWLTASDEAPGGSIVEDNGGITVRQEIRAMGYLRPGQPQEIGFVSMIVVEQDYWGALAFIRQWHESVGIRVPADQPDWIRDAVFYSFHPGGTIGSNWLDLGGFRAASERLVPSLARLGVTAVWMLPVEFRSPYWPLDYYRFMEGLGTGEEFRDLVANLHKAHLYVLQDLVPHGGAPIAVHNQQNPKFMLRREDGSTLTYWLNDFARKDWQDFIAKVTAHYMREYDVDGYRVDACYGSKEPNWDPDIPYARASMAGLWGGLRMLDRIRGTIKELKPKEGALLAELQSTRHWPFSDVEFDFDFGRVTCQQWRQEEPADYAAHLQEYLEEQHLVEPRGALWLRHTESHDTLRSQGWWGVEGMRTMYALSAWIDGTPMIFQEMERGNANELRRINEIRRARPELSRGESYYRAVKCDTPGVFTCLRKLGTRETVVAINFNREPVRARLAWSGGKAEVALGPLGYTVVPEPPPSPEAARPAPAAAKGADSSQVTSGLAFEDATEWFVDTAEGRLHDTFVPLRGEIVPNTQARIYWRPQGTADIWLQATHPLHPAAQRIGVRRRGGPWTIISIEGNVPKELRLAEKHEGRTGLFVLGLGKNYKTQFATAAPVALDVARAADLGVGNLKLRVVGPDYIISNAHYTVILRRQGGAIRELRGNRAGSLATGQDLIGDGDLMSRREAAQAIRASNDVESGISITREKDGVRMVFEGQLRGATRFALRTPPVWYRNEYFFTAAPRFGHKWSLRSEQDFKGDAALVSAMTLPTADRIELLKGGARHQGPGLPDRAVIYSGGKATWSLDEIRGPAIAGASVDGRKLTISLLRGSRATMEGSRPYEFEAVWSTPAVGGK